MEIKVGADLALFQALGHLLLEEEQVPGSVIDQEFVDENTLKEIINLLLLQGNFGKPGAGVCPVRGHSNVQGDRTMSIWEKLPEWMLTALDKEFGIVSPGRTASTRSTR